MEERKAYGESKDDDKIIYSVHFLMAHKSDKTVPIPGLAIPNINFPSEMKSQKIINNNTISEAIRPFFNSVTTTNIKEVCEKLRAIIMKKIKKPAELKEVASEILDHFMLNETGIPVYLEMINSVHDITMSIKVPNEDGTISETKKTINYYFIDECRIRIMIFVRERSTIQKLAELDLGDEDQLDKYNKEREKMLNLIITLCEIYKSRNTGGITISGKNLISCITFLLNNYNNTIKEHLSEKTKYENELLDKLDKGEEIDDDYEMMQKLDILKKMSVLYAEQLYMFLLKGMPDLKKESDIKNIITRVKEEVVPTLEAGHLIANYNEIFKA